MSEQPESVELRDLASLTFGEFNESVGSTFVLSSGEHSVEVELVKATKLPHQREDQQREGFSLLFQLPSGLGVSQGTFRLSHKVIGVFDVYMTPMMPTDQGAQLEAIFN